MSAQPALARRAHEPRQNGRPPLVAVPLPRPHRPRAPFVVLVLVLLGGGLVGLLLLNTALAQGAFALHDLQHQGVVLTEREQGLERRLATEQQPGRLAARARALGMVSAGVPAFLRVPGGEVLGTPHVATAPPPPAPLPPDTPPTSVVQPAGAHPAAGTPGTGAHAARPPAHRPAHGRPAGTAAHQVKPTDPTGPAGPTHRHRSTKGQP